MHPMGEQTQECGEEAQRHRRHCVAHNQEREWTVKAIRGALDDAEHKGPKQHTQNHAPSLEIVIEITDEVGGVQMGTDLVVLTVFHDLIEFLTSQNDIERNKLSGTVGEAFGILHRFVEVVVADS